MYWLLIFSILRKLWIHDHNTFYDIFNTPKESLYLLSMTAYSPDGTDNSPEWYKDKFKLKTSELQKRQK